MLLHEAYRQADHQHDKAEQGLPAGSEIAVLQGHGENPQRVAHVQRRADSGAGVKGVNKRHQRREHVFPLEDFRPHILAARVEHVTGHGDDLGDDDEDLQFPETRHIIEEGIGQRPEDEGVPAHIEDQEELIERDHVVQRAVDHVAGLPRDQVLRNKIHDEIKDPAAQQLHMRKARLVQPAQGEAAVINRFFLLLVHCDIPREECFFRSAGRRCSGKGSPYARGAIRPSR